MKRNRVITVAIVAVFGLVLFLGRLAAQDTSRDPAPPATIRTGVCDLARVLNECQEAKDKSAAMRQSQEQLQAQGNERRDAIRALENEMKELYKVGSEAYESKFEERQERVAQAKVWAEVEMNKLQRRYIRETEQLYLAALAAIDAIATSQGYHLIVSNAVPELGGETPDKLKAAIAQRRVLHHIPEIDITEAVLARLNEDYRTESQ